MSGRRAAHPRSRGENEDEAHRLAARVGSSPLARGKLQWLSTSQRQAVAHPRSRGENVFAVHSSAVRAGSSPLARGKPPAPGD